MKEKRFRGKVFFFQRYVEMMSVENTCKVCSQDWIHCSSNTEWCTHHQQEFLDILESVDFVEECLRYTKDPMYQASIDITRMNVWLGDKKVISLKSLEDSVDPWQLSVVCVLTSQVIFGKAYEKAMLSSPEEFVVCENNPPDRAVIKISKDDYGYVDFITARKCMQGKFMSDIENMNKYMPISLEVEVNLSMNGHCMICIKHGAMVNSIPKIINPKTTTPKPKKVGRRNGKLHRMQTVSQYILRTAYAN